MKKFRIYLISIISFTVFFNSGCKKYLNAKSDKHYAIIKRISDLQGLMDNYNLVSQNDPASAEAASDNYYISDKDFESMPDYLKNLYLWKGDNNFLKGYRSQWTDCYENVYRANIVLSNIDNIKKTSVNEMNWKNVKGRGYFLRAKSFLLAASIWCLAFDEKTASSDLGLPLRLDPDFNKVVPRSTLLETYNQIIEDIKKSIPLLPIEPVHVLRPSKAAAYALLARTYLWMRQYDSCFKYANLSLGLHDQIFDYNLVSESTHYPFSSFKFGLNPGIIMDNQAARKSLLAAANIDSNLYRSYDKNDLRKHLYFKDNGDGTYSYIGSYSGAVYMWDGIATDEIYLMRAECYARKGDVTAAMDDLNTLLVKRWKHGTFIPYTADNTKDALSIILQERRKELVMRCFRWMDIKRLNLEGADIVLKRMVNGESYILPPNDLRYALPLPEDLVNLFELKQNPR